MKFCYTICYMNIIYIENGGIKMPIDKSINYSEITPEIKELGQLCIDNSSIDPALYTKYQVNRGLRDLNGNGVLTGLTEVSDIVATKMVDGQKVPCDGKLYYRGIDVEDIVKGFVTEQRFGFEEVTYLLLFGKLPTVDELDMFTKQLERYRSLPTNFVRDIIMKAPTADMMNTLSRCVLTLYGYDKAANDLSIDNVLRQCMQMIALFPMMSVYSYQAYRHYVLGKSLYIHNPKPGLSTAELILYTLRSNRRYTKLEASVLDMALVLHAEHGGGNNSTFTMHVVTSSGTDTYSAVSASLGSLKGPKHGGANIKVVQMFDDMKKHVKDWTDEAAIEKYLRDLLHKEAFDKAGLIYGMGHAVYSISDPRARVLNSFIQRLAAEKHRDKEYALYAAVERLAPLVIADERKMYKGVSANVDFYSGLVYSMLDLPLELYTPIFAISRVAGWSAHRIEELINAGKIIRPAYKNVLPHDDYVPLKDRK